MDCVNMPSISTQHVWALPYNGVLHHSTLKTVIQLKYTME